MRCTNCGKNCKILGMRDIIGYVREHFEVHEHVSDKTLREKIISVIGEDAWKAAERKIGEKKTGHFFSQDELRRIVYETPFFDYLLERASERFRVRHVQGEQFVQWWADLKIGAEGAQALASEMLDLAFNLCVQLYAEGRLSPLPSVDCQSAGKVDALLDLLKKALMFYPEYADMFGGECGAVAKPEEECQAERISDLVAEKLAPILASTEPQSTMPSSGKHGTFRD